MTTQEKHVRDMTPRERDAAYQRLMRNGNRELAENETRRTLAKLETEQARRLANGTASPAEVRAAAAKRAAERQARDEATRARIVSECTARGLTPDAAEEIATSYIALQGDQT